MKRSLCVFAIGLGLSASLLAADAPKKGKVTPPPASAPRAISGRAQLETLLQSPAKLDFAGRHRITVRVILDKLHEQHRLSLRFDSPTLAALLEKSQGGSSSHTANVASGLGSLPLGLMITSHSSAPAYYPSTATPCPAPACAGPAYPTPNAPPAATFPTASYLEEPVAKVSAYEASPADADDASPKVRPAPAASSRSESNLRHYGGTATTLSPENTAVSPPAVPPVVQGQPIYAPAAAASAASVPAPVPMTADQLIEMKRRPRTESQSKRLKAASDRLREKLEQVEEEQEQNPAVPSAVESTPSATAGSAQSSTSELLQTIDELLETEIDVQTLDLSSVSIATILRHALDAVPTTGGDDFAGMPILITNASLLDYLVEDDGLLITSRMKALSKRETRVYSLKQLSDIPPEQLAKTIRQSIRPWSWRSQINDLGDQLKGTPLPAETMTSLLKSGVQLISAEAGVEVTPSESPEAKPANATSDAKQMEMLGGAISNGLVTLAHSTLLVMEMMHYAEPPTATIQTLGNKLIVTQSQAAHREISELLKQLSDE